MLISCSIASLVWMVVVKNKDYGVSSPGRGRGFNSNQRNDNDIRLHVLSIILLKVIGLSIL